jgi:hypothetical protein
MLEVEVEKIDEVELGVGETEPLFIGACSDMAAVVSYLLRVVVKTEVSCREV